MKIAIVGDYRSHNATHRALTDGLTMAGGEVRIIELPGHPFFVATLFVPRSQAVDGGPHPIYAGLTEAVGRRRKGSAAVR